MSIHLSSIDLRLLEKLQGDRSYRQAFFLAESSALIAKQLIELRKRRGLSQKEVADELQTGQPAISRVERADYRNWSFNTLRRLAAALDARIRVVIEPAEDVIREYIIENKSDQVSELRRIFVRGATDAKPSERALIDEPESALTSPAPKQRPRASILDDADVPPPKQTPKQNGLMGATWN
ncbi:XRE family transcriptional regulator [Bradyrhizobium sp. NDS-1]|uniref:helix-turn-helix domain-containing protein n=1 Tax=Bradyrhizobium sp. NDS-1 TaxID=3080014 RepID=UPI00293E0AE5|nr:XRE family transcriptional regulator [Bradyrhizobium sp. NDS-1]WOH72813.1 XRE family transcriptional regulator [Bradyrhizobium sp. NDS-1]